MSSMKNQTYFEKLIPRTRRSFGLGIAIALSVQAITVFTGFLFIRSVSRRQLIHRDAVALHMTTLMEQLDLEEEGEDLRTEQQIGFDAALRASRLKGVIGIRFYDTDGNFTDSFPANILPEPLEPEALKTVQNLQSTGRFVRAMPLDAVFIYLPQFASGTITRAPIVLTTIPLHRHDANHLAGAAQFIMEGQSLADEYRLLDSRLIGMALMIFLFSGTLLVAMLWPAARRARRLNRELARHHDRLQRANEELALTARISAVGAVSSHLLHGLKNPLASLSQFMASHHTAEAAPPEDADWQDALTASRRMQALVERTMEVLSDAKGEPTYELTVGELGEDLISQLHSEANKREVQPVFEAEGNCKLSSRTANLASLVLVNLLENAIQVTAAGGTVRLSVSRTDDTLFFRVQDQGPGFPPEQIDHLFLPAKSTREGGSGIGLAISRQIADYLGAELQLEQSSANGCTFLLKLPISVCLDPPD